MAVNVVTAVPFSALLLLLGGIDPSQVIESAIVLLGASYAAASLGGLVAAMALGTTRWQLVLRVLLPAAKNGLLAAILLGVGRAVGETMAVLMATGHAVNVPHSVFDSVRTLTATIAAELGEAPEHSPHYSVLFLIGILLFTITFIVNLVADLVVKGIKNK